MPATPWDQTPAGRAATFGWSLAVINSDPELKRIFQSASANNWTTDRFIAAVRGTSWFKHHSDTAREALILMKSDPATYQQRVHQALASIQLQAGSMGARLSAEEMTKMASDSLLLGWSQDQLKQMLSSHITADKAGRYMGDAATSQMHFGTLASQYGVSVAPATMAHWVQGASRGVTNDDQVRQWLIAQASSRYPALAQRLATGETLQQIADPYIQSYAKILEKNPETINLTDPKIQQALASKGADGKPATQTLWQFEENLRKSPEWLKTNNARDSLIDTTHKLLSDFGLVN